jgi:hypothetical protein
VLLALLGVYLDVPALYRTAGWLALAGLVVGGLQSFRAGRFSSRDQLVYGAALAGGYVVTGAITGVLWVAVLLIAATTTFSIVRMIVSFADALENRRVPVSDVLRATLQAWVEEDRAYRRKKQPGA